MPIRMLRPQLRVENGSPFDDTITGGDEPDSFSGGEGDDLLKGGGGDDALAGGLGNDRLVGGAGDDHLYLDTFPTVDPVWEIALGGIGDDTITFSGTATRQVRIDGGEDNDILWIGGGSISNAVIRNVEILQIGGAVTMRSADIDKFGSITFDDDNVINFTGGGAFDLRGHTDPLQNLFVNALGRQDLHIFGLNDMDRLEDGRGNDTLSGRGGNDVLAHGGAFPIRAWGSDLFEGGSGHDTIYAAGAGDSLDGGAGNDQMTLLTPVSHVDGAAGFDTVITEGGNLGSTTFENVERLLMASAAIASFDQLASFRSIGNESDITSLSILSLVGSGTLNLASKGVLDCGRIIARADAFNVHIVGTVGDDDIAGSTTSDTLFGNDGQDLLWGGDGADILGGGAGNDTLEGSAGIDTLQGGAGDDNYVIDGNDELIVESFNNGSDTVTTRTFWTLGKNIENLTLVGNGRIDGNGNWLGNVITGEGDAENLMAGLGGNDVLMGLDGDDTLLGGSGDDHLRGDDENDWLQGGTGDDVLDGGYNGDRLTGGAGADRFIFNVMEFVDRIDDFSVSEDTIVLDIGEFRDIDSEEDALLEARFFHTGAAAADADHRIIYNSVRGTLSYDRDGTGLEGSIVIARLAPGLALTNEHFFYED